MSGAPVVEARGLTRRYGTRVALQDATFEVAAGEIFGVIGPDGAGKTTLFRILTTLVLPDAGEARVLGHDVVRDLWEIRRRVGYMPGRFSLYPDLSVDENLRFFAAVFGTTIEEGEALIAPIWSQIERFRDRRAGALSGGMKQKLALCCALVHRPEVLFLDEPTTGVDAVSRREFWDLLAMLRASGLPILVSTPYMDEAQRCDRIALLQEGRILEIAPPADIGRRYPRPLLTMGGAAGAERPRLLAALRALPDAYSAFPFGSEIHYADRRAGADVAAIAGELTARLRDAGFPDARVAPAVPGIEDVFMALMRAPASEAA